jgi:SAM-dependent methyltransferase
VWEGDRGLDELRSYLGPDYDERRLHEHVQEVEREESAAADEADFYRTSTAYLYDLTVFAMTGTKTPYLQRLRRAVPPGSRLLDYGCGIGSDGLRLLELGYRVSFADFDNPSAAYLRWRLEQRGRTADIHNIEDTVPVGFDAVYCFDVIEHVDDPFGMLHELEKRGEVVAVNFLEPTPDDVHVHKPLPIKDLLDHVNRHQLLSYDLLHGRSHVVVYRPQPSDRRYAAEKVRTRVVDGTDRRVARRLDS